MPLKQQTIVATKSNQEKQTVCLSKSLEKSFRSLCESATREAYVEAELVNGLAHQIRILREERGWTQKDLATRLNTTQTTVSRLEDPSYGRFSIRTLLSLGKVFDVAIFVRYLPFSRFMQETWDTKPERFKATGYQEEAALIQFFSDEIAQSTEPQLYENVLTDEDAAAVLWFLNTVPPEREVTLQDITVKGEPICLIR